jgi:hypothetical protein
MEIYKPIQDTRSIFVDTPLFSSVSKNLKIIRITRNFSQSSFKAWTVRFLFTSITDQHPLSWEYAVIAGFGSEID